LPNGKRKLVQEFFLCDQITNIMNQLPIYVPAVFILTVLAAIFMFWSASNRKPVVAFIIIGWAVLQMALTLSSFFTVTNTIPPRLSLLFIPPLIFIIVIFSKRNWRESLLSFNQAGLTRIHLLRLAVELVLYWLFIYRMAPQLMTFEGRNFDILSGLTAPVVYYLGYQRKILGARFLIGWNIACLLILSFTVTNAILAAPSMFQQLAFDQPLRAILYFPFIWLPGIMVPLVYYSHIISIYQLKKQLEGVRNLQLQ